MSQLCNFCNKLFSSKPNLVFHQKTAKYCLKLQGKETSEYHCDHCSKNFTTACNLEEHLTCCKERRIKESVSKSTEQSKKKIKKDYEEKISLFKKEYEEKLSLQKKEYEEKLSLQKKEYEEKLASQQNIINTIALRPSTTTTKNTVINNNQHILNFNDKEKLNNLIKNKVTQSVVKRGQIGLANVLFNNYLKDDQGNQLYKVTDTSRQNFEYTDETGEARTDVGEKRLTDAISKSNLTQHVAGIAKDIPDLYDKNTGCLDEVTELTNFDQDHSRFRKEIVRLAKTS